MAPYLDPTRHPSEEQLEFYALARLREPDLEHLEVHLLSCVPCQEAVTEADAYLSPLRAVLAEIQPVAEPVRPWAAWWKQLRLFPPMPVVAAGVATLLIGVLLSRSPADLQPTAVTLRSERGGAVDLAAQGPADSPLDLRIQSTHLTVSPDYRISIVDDAGRRAWAGSFDASVVHVRDGLSAGTYWVRLYDGQEHLLQEYGLQVN